MKFFLFQSLACLLTLVASGQDQQSAIVVNVRDLGAVGDGQTDDTKAIQAANLGLNPAIDGKVIRLVLPELSQERREELVKVAKKITEDGRVAVRHVRRDAMDGLKKSGKEAGGSEDEIKGAEKQVQKLTDDFIKKLDAHLADKEDEIRTV